MRLTGVQPAGDWTVRRPRTGLPGTFCHSRRVWQHVNSQERRTKSSHWVKRTLSLFLWLRRRKRRKENEWPPFFTAGFKPQVKPMIGERRSFELDVTLKF